MLRKTIFLILFLSVSWFTFSQETVVVGQVFDKYEKIPLQSVKVYFQGTQTYTLTNEEGYFLIRNRGKETKLVFSIVGYNKEEVDIKRGSDVAVNIELEQKVNLLNEILVIPGINPAIDFMRKVRLNRHRNNINLYSKGVEQNLVFLSKEDTEWRKSLLFKQFSSANMSKNDSLILVPLYMKETEFSQKGGKKKVLNINNFNTSQSTILSIEILVRNTGKRVNFYENAINIMGKNMISPLASVGSSFYHYYLIDSTKTETGGKEYTIDFRTKNRKNLAFNGSMKIDSATYALTEISAELPIQANLNFIHNLTIKQKYKPIKSFFTIAESETSWYLTYELIKKENNQSAELLMKNSTHFSNNENDSLKFFANTTYSANNLQNKMETLHENKLFKVASYLADASFTNYMKVGKIDIGKLDNIIRYNNVEGISLAFPFRTNEDFSKQIMLGTFIGYGFNHKKWKYGINLNWRPTFLGGKTVLGTAYVDDYRKTEFEYNKFSWYNNPLAMSGRPITSTLLAFYPDKSHLSRRKEFSLSLKHDWSKNIESGVTYKNITYLPNKYLPFNKEMKNYSALYQQELSLISRFAFDEKIYYDHFQKIYLNTEKPIFYTVLDVGKYHLSESKGNYARVTANVYQHSNFLFGKWRYGMEVGKIFGKVPYPLLHKYKKMSGITYDLFRFYTMNSNEYISDSYITAMGEVNLNGVFFNYIPLIKHLNLRELFGLRMAYGTLSNSHNNILEVPNYTTSFKKPYVEASVGFTNLLGIFSIQSIWRLTDWKQSNDKKWCIEASILFSL